MHLDTPREAFLSSLQLVAGLCPTRSPRLILKDVLFEANGGEVVMSATNGDVSVRTRLQAEGVQGSGRAALPAATLLAAVRSLPGDTLRISEKGGQHEISGGGSVFKLFGDDPEQFPALVWVDLGRVLEMPLAGFLDLCQRTMFAAAKELGRYAFHGVLLEAEPEGLALVATDGRRLSLAALACATGVSQRQTGVMPIDGLAQVQRAAASQDAATLAIEMRAGQVAFALGATEIVAQLVEGDFPDYRAVLPKEKDLPRTCRLKRQDLEEAIRRAAVTAGQEGRSIELTFEPGSLRISSREEGVGESRSQMEIAFEGEPASIRFNPEFLSEYLRSVPEEEVDFRFKDRMGAGVFSPGGRNVYVVMPITS